MSGLTIGRVGLDVVVSEIESLGFSGDALSLSGVLLADTLNDVKVLRQQLVGYVGNGDEEIVPVTWDEDSTLDGFYRVTSVEVSTVPASYVANWFRFSLGLERVSGYAGPLMETIVTGAVRTNTHSITSANAVAVVGVPDAANEFYDSSGEDTFTRPSADGLVRLVAADAYTRTQTFSVDPGDWYAGAARIEYGTSYRVAVGQQIPSERETWRLSNGIIRVRPNADGFAVSVFNGTTWDPEKVFALSGAGVLFGAVDLAYGLRVLRNSPEECIVRIPVSIPSAILSAIGTSVRVDIDLALRRGERVVRGFLASTADVKWGVEASTAEAATALTGGIRATANDANGNRYVLSSPQAVTNDLTQGGFETTATATTFSFAAGFELDGSGAPAVDAAQALIYQYMAAHAERVVVATR